MIDSIESVKSLLDKGYLTTKGALFMIFELFRQQERNLLDPDDLINTLNISKPTFYKVTKEIQNQEGWKFKVGRTISIETDN
jgi:hypothetical protein